MIRIIIGAIVSLLGLLMLIFGPGGRGQIDAYGNTARLIGFILLVIGVLLIKL